LEFGVFKQIIPDVEKLTDISLTAPHTYNAWDHSMQVVHYCQQIMAQIGVSTKLEHIHPRIAQAVTRLAPFHKNIYSFFNQPIVFERTQYQLLIISALFHDAAKAVVDHAFSGERKRFPNHARVGADLTRDWAKKMGFSNREIELMWNTVRFHMRPSKHAFTDSARQKVAVHRLFKKANSGGMHVAILHLADVLTTYEDALSDSRWEEALLAVENMFDAYFNHYETVISPTALLNGNEIIDQMHLQPGKQIGELVDALTEAQVAGEIENREDAFHYLQKLVSTKKDTEE